MEGCEKLYDHKLDAVYNELEIYNWNGQNWTGPDVYFSPPRDHGTDHTKTFDTFWLEDVVENFGPDNCFEDHCAKSNPCESKG